VNADWVAWASMIGVTAFVVLTVLALVELLLDLFERDK
jgi:hypothetical protein